MKSSSLQQIQTSCSLPALLFLPTRGRLTSVHPTSVLLGFSAALACPKFHPKFRLSSQPGASKGVWTRLAKVDPANASWRKPVPAKANPTLRQPPEPTTAGWLALARWLQLAMAGWLRHWQWHWLWHWRWHWLWLCLWH